MWRRIPIFVSSTFKDMNEERDVLKFDVCRRLDEEYSSRRICFQFIDLRVGINTENMDESDAEDSILDICFENIDASRPFFIGLLGGRYGWIPPQQRWRDILEHLSEEKRILLGYDYNKSVTEMEMLYGSIGEDGKHLENSIFFIRDEHSYDGMPDSVRQTYDDACQEKTSHNTAKISALKEKLSHLYEREGIERVFYPYRLTWNGSQFGNIQEFADLAFCVLKNKIDKYVEETGLSAEIDEDLLTTDYLTHLNSSHITHLSYYDQILRELSNDTKFTAILGPCGCGKKALLTNVFLEYSKQSKNKSYIVYFGTSAGTCTMRDALCFLVRQMYKDLGQAIPENLDEFDSLTIESLVVSLSVSLNGVNIFMADIDHISTTSNNDVAMRWVDSISGMVIVTAKSDYDGRLGSLCKQRRLIKMPDLFDSDRKLIIDELQKKINIKLPGVLSSEMIHNEFLSPLDLSLIMSMYANYSSENIRKIADLGGSDIDKINDYFILLFKETITDTNGILCHVLTQISAQLGLKDEYLKMLKYVSLSACGLSVSDLENLVPGLIPMKVRLILHLLKDIIYERPTQGTISFINEDIASRFITNREEKALIYGDLARYVSHLPEANPLREMLPLYAIREGKGRYKELISSRQDSDYYKKIYRGSICYLSSNDDMIIDMTSYCSYLTDAETIQATTGILDAMKIYDTISLHQSIHDTIFSDLNPEDISDEEALYRYAFFYSELRIIDKMLSRDQYDSISRSMEAFKICFENHNSYRDSKNMYITMASAMMPIMMEKGESFEKVMELNNYLDTL